MSLRLFRGMLRYWKHRQERELQNVLSANAQRRLVMQLQRCFATGGRRVKVNFAMRKSLAAHVAFGSWPRENSNAFRARRRISEELRIMTLNHAAQIRLDTVFENCIFYISSMYEFLHSQGQKAKNSV